MGRDRSFLDIAIIAGIGGVLSLAFSIGMPLAAWLHGRPATPAFFFFGLWGVAALCGCAASIHTYFVSGVPPDRPPRGGLRVLSGGGRTSEGSDERRAA